MSFYTIEYKTKEALENWLDIIKPELDDLGKIEVLRRCYMALKLHELPLSLAVFVFDAALLDLRKAVELRDVAIANHHWFEVLAFRVKNIGTSHLKELLSYLTPFEQEEHHVKKSSGNVSNERSNQGKESRP